MLKLRMDEDEFVGFTKNHFFISCHGGVQFAACSSRHFAEEIALKFSRGLRGERVVN